MKKGELSHLVAPGVDLNVRVTPKAGRNAVRETGTGLAVQVTEAPENGKANAAVQKLLARALGVAKTRLVLVRGDTARDKVFRLD